MPMQLLSPDQEQELKSLWSDRARLDEKQWIRLCVLVTAVLRHCRPGEMRSLNESHDDYIQGFILHKVLRTKFSGTQLDSAAALCTFFTRYLRNMLKTGGERLQYSDDEESLERLADQQAADAGSPCACESVEDRADFARFIESARQFWSELEIEDQIYLALHTCDPESEPLYAIAERYRIASYHYRAGRLGITRKKTDLPDSYGKTRIGQWMKEKLKIAMTGEGMSEIERAFQALCATALHMRDDLVKRLGYA